MKAKLLIIAALTLIWMSGLAFAKDPPAVKCVICNMKVDTGHKVHFRYEVDGKIHDIGSLSCAKRFWEKNKGKKLKFTAQDFVSGAWLDPKDGFFLVGSKLNVGTGMDKGGAVFFREKAMAEKAQRVNGGRVVNLDQALQAVQGG